VKNIVEEYDTRELHKPSKYFTQFTQSGGEDKSIVFLTQADSQGKLDSDQPEVSRSRHPNNTGSGGRLSGWTLLAVTPH